MVSEQQLHNIFLTGFSGTGKSTVGREVARRLGWRYVDTDAEIVRAAGKSIDAIFRDDSEARFRELERRSLAEACRREMQVVSTGGGVVMDESNRRLMEAAGLVVCLEARPKRYGAGSVPRIASLRSRRSGHCWAAAYWTASVP